MSYTITRAHKLTAADLFACFSFTNHSLPVPFDVSWWKSHMTHIIVYKDLRFHTERHVHKRKTTKQAINKSINHVEHISGSWVAAWSKLIEIHKCTDLVRYTKGTRNIMWRKLWEWFFPPEIHTKPQIEGNRRCVSEIKSCLTFRWCSFWCFISQSAEPDLHPQTEPIKTQRPTSESHQLSSRLTIFIHYSQRSWNTAGHTNMSSRDLILRQLKVLLWKKGQEFGVSKVIVFEGNYIFIQQGSIKFKAV